MADAQLLDIEDLAALQEGEETGKSSLIRELMVGAGLTDDEARSALTTLSEAAAGLWDHFQGKVQRYLRHYGETMVDEIAGTFAFTAMEPRTAAEAFRYWLQNVLNMPVSLDDIWIQQFCERYGFSAADLLAAADAMDVNVALVDDLARLHTASVESEKAAEPNGEVRGLARSQRRSKGAAPRS